MSIPVVRQTVPNPCAATENRQTFDALGLVCVDVVGPTGAGKTSFLQAVLPRLMSDLRVGVLEGDLVATCDAQRLSARDLPVVQVLTDGQHCLAAYQVQKGIVELPLASLDLLLIENVGSPVYPRHMYLGEHLRATVLALSGGEQVVTKYPDLIQESQLILLSKYSLLPHVDFDLNTAVQRMRQLNPRAEIICTDTKNRIGIDRAAGWLLGYVRAQRGRQLCRGRLTEPVGALT